MEPKKLKRSRNKMLAGVCAGIAEYYDLDPTLVRAGVAIISVFTAIIPALIAYLVVWFVMPESN